MQAFLFRQKRFAIVVTTVILVIVITLSLFFYLNSEAKCYSGKTQSITIGNLPLESSALLYVADKQGFFKQNGLNVTIQDSVLPDFTNYIYVEGLNSVKPESVNIIH